jgi:hypothetical protein
MNVSVITDLTPTQYELIRIGIQCDETKIVAIADIRIYNAGDRAMTTHNLDITLTPDEEQMLTRLIDRELGAFETRDKLTKYVPPKEEIPTQ